MLSFFLHAPIAETGLTLLLPKWMNGLIFRKVEMDGKPLVYKEIMVKGRPSVLANVGGGGTFQIQAYFDQQK